MHNTIANGFGCSCQPYMFENFSKTASSYMGKYCAFPHILESPSSYMTLQLLHSEFPYICGKFDFLFYQCSSPTCYGSSLGSNPDISQKYKMVEWQTHSSPQKKYKEKNKIHWSMARLRTWKSLYKF